jgi:hypothetical protein
VIKGMVEIAERVFDEAERDKRDRVINPEDNIITYSL